MKKQFTVLMLLFFIFAVSCAAQSDPSGAVVFERYESYFENNSSGLKGDKSFLAFTDQKKFDKIFGAAATMGENTFLPEEIFKSKIVVAAIKRGSLRKYNDVKVTAENGKLYVWYNAEDDEPGSASYSSPLIISVDKGKYKEVVFMENGKKAKSVKIKN